MEWDFGKTTKKCTDCNKTLPTDEFFFSALFFLRTARPPAGQANPQDESVDESVRPDATSGRLGGDGRFLRQDYCATCWTSKRESVFSYWKTKITAKQITKTPREVLIEFFDNLLNYSQDKPPMVPDDKAAMDEAIRSKIIYLFSLILLRRKIFKIKESIRKDNQPFIVFERVPDGKGYEVAELSISEEELVKLKDQFSKLFEFEI